MKSISVNSPAGNSISIGNDGELVLIAGPCAIESYDHCMTMADLIGKVCDKYNVKWIFKACYDKDCRSSPTSFHGVGLEEGLAILERVRSETGLPVTSDFSDPAWGKATGEVCDFVQVPAYLCRQPSILRAAASSGKPVHLKKGQFMSPWNMKNSCRKLEAFGCDQILLTDRGTFFGYNMLINDMRAFPIMAETGYPVCYDATHSIQMPTSMGNISGGQREYIPNLTRAAAACGIDAMFMEVHDDPPNALSDANTVLDIRFFEVVLAQAKTIHDARRELKAKWGEDHVHLD
ncbi:MAG: 3-deoxy-8-phosphooctulonate synthase [Gammaproteobacteria bacterium]|nr:3-deoxy-8-phosphooctulonate synthase [Gammaproteobacteria bacterium]OUX81091.1 MAG: 3-deoxy-8-phosphooctulonate synthase [Oceanospirillales bacterium TMED59]